MDAVSGQRETASPIYMRDRRISALQAEPNAPLYIFSPLIEDSQQYEVSVDRRKGIEAAQEAAVRRQRLQSVQLKRFHQQICLRVNERVVEERELRQSLEKRVDAKLARLLQLPSAADQSQLQGRSDPFVSPPLRLSRRPFADALLQQTRDRLQQSASSVASLVENAVRSDAMAREMLLRPTHLTRVRGARECEDDALDADERNNDNQVLHDASRQSEVDLPLKQRKELYAAVRRQFMVAERERVKERERCARTVTKATTPTKETARERTEGTPVKIVDVSVGGEVKMQRHSAKPSPTTWRKRSESTPLPSNVKPRERVSNQIIHERFLDALQEELRTPALCSCRKQRGQTQCANNCEFYRQPKKKEKAVASVCKQHISK